MSDACVTLQCAAELEWRPPSARVLLEMIDDTTRRYVETPDELMVESLRRLDERLNGCETPVAHLLWDTKGEPSPKDETALSDMIKDHLRTDLLDRRLVINREVEMPPARVGVGLRPDIHVTAVGSDGDHLAVYIEVKRCNHRNRGSALGKQLVEEYLRPTGNHAGIYAVGHYDCRVWGRCRETRAEMVAQLFGTPHLLSGD